MLQQSVAPLVAGKRAIPVNRQGRRCVRGLAAATGEARMVQDADLDRPAEYPLMLGRMRQGRCCLWFALGGRPHRIVFFWHMVGNKLLTLFSNIFSNLNLTDMETGFDSSGFRAERCGIMREPF